MVESAAMLEKVDSMADTIVACATPPGEGAIAIVRLSGPAARDVGDRIAPADKPRGSHQMVVVTARDSSGRVLDRAMKVEMHAPRSYTGEDVVELHLHGSRVVVDAVISACVEQGARMARPGEFSLRAFLNGRMDLAQAEALCDLINARSRAQHTLATVQLEGGLSRQIERLVDRLEGILADWRIVLDFPEHLERGTDIPAHRETLGDVACSIQNLIDSARVDILKGLRVVLCGAPNVGKSTLLNAWAGHVRVLVDPQPGTTRDPVEVELSDHSLRWVVCDTAGVRDCEESLEARGMAMSLAWVRQADIALWLVDPNKPEWPPEGLDVWIVGGKKDVSQAEQRRAIEERAAPRFYGWVSPLTGEGVSELRERVVAGSVRPVAQGEAVVVRQRHVQALAGAHRALKRVLGSLDTMTHDVLCMDIEEAARNLGSILGRDVDAAVLDRIFSEFCLGK